MSWPNLREDQLDGCFERLCDCDHDISAKHPKDVIEEEPAEQDAASHDVVQVEQLHSIDGKGHAKQVVRQPVLLKNVPNTNHGAEAQAHL